MPAFVSTLNILHLILSAGFVVVTFALFGISAFNRTRVRNVILTWRPDARRNFPYGPLLFALLILAIAVVTHRVGGGIATHLLVGYGAGALAWFGAVWISGVAIVSDCGIIANIHNRERSIAWGQVMDYFEFSSCDGEGIVLFHRCDDGRPVRLELLVPEPMRSELIGLVDAQLRLRSGRTDRRIHGKTALEG